MGGVGGARRRAWRCLRVLAAAPTTLDVERWKDAREGCWVCLFLMKL